MMRMIYTVDSTISSGLNSLSAVCLQDLLRLLCFKDMSEKHATLASKLICTNFDHFIHELPSF